MNILIVDDNTTNLKLLHAQLETEGHVIFEAGDGIDALKVLAGAGVDAVISDILMPKLDGFGLCLAVRKDERLSDLPFVFYTSTYTSAADMQLARTVGANCYLRKPAPLPALVAALREASVHTTTRTVTDETDVLRRHNLALQKKLEERDASLKQAVKRLERAHELIAESNRLTGRTPAGMQAKGEAVGTPSSLSRRPPAPPVCPRCQRIRDDDNSWQSMERYLDPCVSAALSHALCEECDAKHTTRMEQFIARHSPSSV